MGKALYSLEQHSSNATVLIREDILKYLASHIEHTEQCVSLLKQYLPLLPQEYLSTIQKLELTADLHIHNSKEALKNINSLYAKNEKQRIN